MWGVLISALMSAASWLLPRALIGAGVFAASNAVSGPALQQLQQLIMSKMGAAPAAVVQLTQLMGMWDFVQILLSAQIAALAMKAAKGAIQSAAVTGTNKTAP